MQKPRFAVFAVAFAVAAAPSFAQGQQSLAVAAPAAAKPASALDDPTIVAIFDAANTWDVETGTLALEKSRNKDVRDFAKMMIHDHTAVRKLGRDLATKLKVTPTPPGKDFALYQAHLAAMKQLKSLDGKAFDKAYMDHEVAYHQAVIDAVTTTLLPATQNAELKNLQTTVAPNFVAHLAVAKKVQGELASK
jgi:putative membrane protein